MGRIEIKLSDLLCWRFRRFSLHEFRAWLGDHHFERFLEDFAGCYVKIPPTAAIQKVLDDYQLAMATQTIKEARKAKDFNRWSKAEALIEKVAKRNKRSAQWGRSRGRNVLKEIKEAKDWAKQMHVWRDRFLKEQGE